MPETKGIIICHWEVGGGGEWGEGEGGTLFRESTFGEVYVLTCQIELP